ncbi:sensor histidine kinase [Propionibacteriaceae bacterium Y1685]
MRGRILAAVLLTTALAMLFAGSVSYALARYDVDRQIAESLAQEVLEFRANARQTSDPTNEILITGPEDILRYAVGATYPDDNEGVLALVNGAVSLVPASGTDLQRSLQVDQEFIARAAAVQPDEQVRVLYTSTAAHSDLAYISIPTQVEGNPDLGHYVVAIDRAVPHREVNRNHLVYAGAGIVVLGLVGAVGHHVAGRMLAPLRSLRTTAQRITDTDLSERIPSDQLQSRDEVADLGRTMNQMLDRLSTSFDTQRRLLDDAGHELRTPITIVRGHLELVDPHKPEEVVETRELVLDELDRMQRLVDDLLTLAKSRRPDFISPAPFALDELVSTVLDKVTPLGRRAWTVDSEVDEMIIGDQQRISQAMIQLVANAVRHTEEGDVIALGAEVEDRCVRIWVRDEGAGITDEDQERIFTRFTRGGGTVDHDGAGLGLSIVSAIAQAHRGHVELESTLDAGSTFTMIIPYDNAEEL